MLEVRTSLDWSQVETELRRLSRLLPEFKSDIRRIKTRIQTQISELSRLEVEARHHNTASKQELCRRKAEAINAELKQVEKIHLMSLLSR